MKQILSKTSALFAIYALLMLWLSYISTPIHDYFGYFRHWDLVLSGGDPWMKMIGANAYGPIHNVFAWLYAIDIMLPKLFFVASWLAVAIYSVHKFNQFNTVTQANKILFGLFWLANPFFFVGAVMYGFNDNFAALIVFIALLAFFQNQSINQSAVWLTIGFLTKLYPAYLLAFLAENKKQFKSVLLIFFVLIIAVYGLTYYVWGGSFVNAFGKANGRDPTLFSVMRVVHGDYFPFPSIAMYIVESYKLLILLSIWFLLKQFFKGELSKHALFLAAFTALLMFYKAGQQQFFIAYFAVFSIWVLIEFKSAKPDLTVFYSVLVLGLWFAVMAGIVYPLTSFKGDYAIIQEWLGLPTFLLEAIILYFLVRNGRRVKSV